MKEKEKIKNYFVQVFGKIVLRADVPQNIVEKLKELNWKVEKGETGENYLISSEDVHEWIKGEVLIRENSTLYIPDLELKTDRGLVEIYLSSGTYKRDNIYDFESYRIFKNATEIVKAANELASLMEEKAYIIEEEERILEQMKILNFDEEEIKKHEEKIKLHKKELERDYMKLSDTIPKIRENVNLITLRNLLIILNKLEKEHPSEYREVKDVIREVALKYFSAGKKKRM